MVVTIPQIIATINPDLYYSAPGDGQEAEKNLKKFKKLIEEEGFQKAATEAKPKSESEHLLVYDSSTETLEPVYFWLLDLMNGKLGGDVIKLVDNFSSSPGSGHFQELQTRSFQQQQQGQNMLAQVNAILRSVLNIIYDLKDFKIRLQSYDDLNANDKGKKEAALLSLKQIWMDKVDIQKGNSSIKAMALGQAGFQTLIDAFLVAKDAKDTDKIDLNERVKRLVKARIEEFNIWLKMSESELRKRYILERTYLKSQVNSLKMYSRWAKPYLKSAFALEQKEQGRNPDFVKTFNTILLELTLFGKSEVKPTPEMGDIKLNRKYYQCILVDFYFRGIPQRIAQQSHFAFGGRIEMTFRSYALNEDEIKKLEKELEKSDLGDVLNLIEGTTTESLDQLQEEIDLFLNEEENEKKEKEKPQDTSNPFLALIGKYNKKAEKKEKKSSTKKDEDKPIKPDSWIEKTHIRPLAAAEVKITTYDIFDIYKKAHQMPSFNWKDKVY